MSNVAARVSKIISDKLGVSPEEITAEANIARDLGADSIDLVELTMEFEREFELSIPDESAQRIQTVGDAIAYLENNT